MTAYELMIKANRYLISGGTLTDAQKQTITRQLLAAKSTPERARRFCSAAERSADGEAHVRCMYPLYFVPPYNDGRKLKTILDQTPKTQILSANAYELEILRLLNLLAPNNADVAEMTAVTLERLKTTCFGYMDDGVGECFDASLVVLRFLAAAAPGDTEWINSRIANFDRHYAEKKRTSFCLWYFWLCLSELPFAVSKPETDKYKDMMLALTGKSLVMNSEHDKALHPVLFSILRDNLSRYPEYAYIKGREPYIGEADGRLHFDMCIHGEAAEDQIRTVINETA